MVSKWHNLSDIYQNNAGLSDLQHIFSTLKQLNQILANILPSHLLKFCHIGSLDSNTNTVVIFVNNQQVLHILKNMSNQILQGLCASGYDFNNLLLKVSPDA